MFIQLVNKHLKFGFHNALQRINNNFANTYYNTVYCYH